jgi:tRNA(fMet)-specific endonuclease VapC
VPFDDELAWQWAVVSSIKGKPIEPGDAWVAATALRHGLPLVTHNRRHFQHIPALQVISESP